MIGIQSALDPKGLAAARTTSLTWFLVIVATVVYLIVMGVLLRAFIRGRQRRGLPIEHLPADESAAEEAEKETLMRRWVKIAVGTAAAILLLFIFVDAETGSANSHIPSSKPLRIDVTGNQWWWAVEYDDPVAQNRITTANEIHVPVGRPVLLKLRSHDVIHSFWAPNLAGKHDLVPGHETVTWFRADTVGVYRGQCAEFCGHQHAKMAFYIVAEPKTAFDAWVLNQRQPAAKVPDSLASEGEKVFLSSSCAVCHNITGTGAGGNVGPDLTHLASRNTIAAGSLGNNSANLMAWITNPQAIKPGVKMPGTQLNGAQLDALVAYLGTLK